MAKYLYARVSTLQQDYAQQRNTIDLYLESARIPLTEITSELVEKITGVDEHTNRKFAHLFAKCKAGDTIYFSELSRIGRSMSDLNNIVHEACKRGIILMQCKDGMRIEDETIGGKALLFALSLAAEIEVQNLHQRTQSGVDVAISELKKNGYRITKSGTIQTHWGRAKGCDNTAACEASAIARQDARIAWAQSSVGYQWAMEKVAEGWTNNDIIAEFNKHHQRQPEVYCTRAGKPLSKGVLSKWRAMANPIALIPQS